MRLKIVLFELLVIGIISLVFCCPELDDQNQKIKPKRMVARSGGHHRLSICCRKRKSKQRSMVRFNLQKPTLSINKSPSTTIPAPTTQSVTSKPVDIKIKKKQLLKKVSQIFKTTGLFNDNNPCMIWMSCPVHHDPQFKAWLHGLPSCPCSFSPSSLYNNNTVYDKLQQRFFNWKVVDAKREKLSVFKPYAAYCIQQQLSLSAISPSVQQCCYDRKFQLITRGNGAGTPSLVAPEIDYYMHSEVDLKPFVLCQGDWVRYQVIRSPNNGNNCTDNPKQREFTEQVQRARDY